ncbi:SDR family NAD(P)-dependent oxidoreductase, partial [Candidatus Bathyarchaeota archaeon]|nr:SDR family NAD(P)-dependent oxidoreductase [Candidatus Bathyarchaeota archaeon]
MNFCEKALVTGGAGFIGSHIVDRLLEDGVGVVVLDDLSGGNVANIRHQLGKEGFRFVQGDIRDSGLVKEVVRGVDVVFHYAALVSVQQSVADPVLVNDVNVAGTLNVLTA